MFMFRYFISIILSCVIVFSARSQSGLFMRTIYFGSQLDVSWMFFTSDKKIIRNPKYGVNPVMIEKELAENTNNVGVIIRSGGGKMTVKWGNTKEYIVNVEYTNGMLSAFDGGLCTKPSVFPFKRFANKTYSGLALVGNITRSVTLFLGDDGRFTSETIGTVSGSGNFSGAAASTRKESGTYTLNSNTIIFKYSDGKVWIVVAQPYDLGNEEIIIGDQLFKKVK